mmetsp:Transcript_17080/g.39863  ORF Transcript_17080/g.39863 Transcript_17080/m.39863 type:complete len:267 (-) Transcript_17080:16-816(-)
MGLLSGLFGGGTSPEPHEEDSSEAVTLEGAMLSDNLSTQANEYTEKLFQDMVATYDKMQTVVLKTQADWRTHGDELKRACNGVHSNLRHLAGSASTCQMQQDKSLSALFRARAGSHFKQAITGCANTEVTNDLVRASDCQCAGGTEVDGCKDPKTDADHTLLCTHLRRKVLPELHLQNLMNGGGACDVDMKASFNKPLLPPSVPHAIREQAVGALSAWFVLCAPACAREEGAVRGCGRSSSEVYPRQACERATSHASSPMPGRVFL